jgi:hypothetical protein
MIKLSSALRRMGPLWLGLALCSVANAQAAAPLSLWPTVPFIRGQDLCQFQDAYGKSRSEQALEMTSRLKDLLAYGAQADEALDSLLAMDALIDKNRKLATTGFGMDMTLEAGLKAALDGLYRELKPRERKLVFINPVPLLELLRDLRTQQRQGNLDLKQLSKISGFAWGTYAYGPGCRGDVLVSIHVELATGASHSFQAQGRPESVMSSVAGQIFQHFQRTQFPSLVSIGKKSLTLLGAPGSPIGMAPSPSLAESACKASRARLPLVDEYEFLSALGDWSGGVSLDHKLWALADDHVLAPDLRNPSPVRHPEDVNSNEIYFYCVR